VAADVQHSCIVHSPLAWPTTASANAISILITSKKAAETAQAKQQQPVRQTLGRQAKAKQRRQWRMRRDA